MQLKLVLSRQRAAKRGREEHHNQLKSLSTTLFFSSTPISIRQEHSHHNHQLRSGVHLSGLFYSGEKETSNRLFALFRKNYYK
jgi:hypothetical protein